MQYIIALADVVENTLAMGMLGNLCLKASFVGPRKKALPSTMFQLSLSI